MSAEQLITQHINTWTSALQTRATAGRGNNGKIDLYGIKKLRELILELAVRGKLVPQDPNDEPASELLKRIAAEKAEMVKQGKIKKQKPLPEISEDEKPYELPQGWEWTRLIELGIWALGSGFPNAIQGINNEEILLCKVSDMNLEGNERFITHTNNTISVETAKKYKINICDPGTIVFPKIGGAIATNKRRIIERRTAIDNNCLGIKPSGAVNLDWFYLILSSINMAQYQSGTSVPAINQGTIGNIPVGLPPEKLQLRIFSKVKELMSIVDQLEYQSLASLGAHQQLVKILLATLTNSQNAEELAENWARISQYFDTLFTTEESIDALKQTILQLAVMGKLVPQDPSDESASELLKRIEQEKAQLVKEGKIKKQKPLPPVSDEEKPFGLPVGWEWCRLAEMSHLSEAGWSPQCESEPRINDEWGVLKISAVTWGEYNPNENKALPHNLNPKKEYEVRERDFLISRANTAELVARSVIVPSPTVRHLMLSDKIIRYQFTNLVSVEYLNLMNNCSFSRDYYSNVAGGTSSSMKNVSRNQVSMLPIALPPYKEQLEIIKQVTIFNRLCTKLKSHLQSAQQTQLHLADALIDAALS